MYICDKKKMNKYSWIVATTLEKGGRAGAYPKRCRGAELLVFKTKSDQIAIWFDFGPVSALRFHPVNHSFFLPDSLISCNKVFSISQP